MNKKIIAVAAVGIIAIGVYANSPFGEKVVFDNNPIVQTMQLKQQNQLDGVLSALKETGINPDDIKSWKPTGNTNQLGRTEYVFSTDGKKFNYHLWMNKNLSVFSITYSGSVLYKDGKLIETITDNKPSEKEMQHMQTQAEKVVKRSLKAPDSAKFSEFKFMKQHGIGTISGVVNAKNSFGALIRTPFNFSFDFKNQNGAMIRGSINGEELVKD